MNASSIQDHFCSDKCKLDDKACDLCVAQREKQRGDFCRQEAKPTMQYKAFAGLAKFVV